VLTLLKKRCAYLLTAAKQKTCVNRKCKYVSLQFGLKVVVAYMIPISLSRQTGMQLNRRET
jgi:hypothetical protein